MTRQDKQITDNKSNEINKRLTTKSTNTKLTRNTTYNTLLLTLYTTTARHCDKGRVLTGTTADRRVL
jgi:hypothetical protein